MILRRNLYEWKIVGTPHKSIQFSMASIEVSGAKKNISDMGMAMPGLPPGLSNV